MPEKVKTDAIEGFVGVNRDTVTDIIIKELKATRADVAFPKEVYKEIITLKFARGSKNPETSGTIGYIVYTDGSLEELDDKTKLVELPWHSYTTEAIVICYLSMRSPTYRVYGAQKLQDVFGVTAGDNSL